MKYVFILFYLIAIIGCTSNQYEKDTGKVVGISDGDTFTLLTQDNAQLKVRLYGIDTPESKQPFGTVAKQYLSQLIFGKKVYYEVKDIDRYKRTVAVVFTQNGLNVNEEMIKAGYAWHYKQYDKNPDWDHLEKEARLKKAGLWVDKRALPPWEYRKQAREKTLQE